MIILATSLTLLTMSAIVCSLCRIPSRAWRPVRDKSLVIDNVEDSRRLLTERGFRLSRRGEPGHLAVENYW